MNARTFRSALAVAVGLAGLSASARAVAEEPTNDYCHKVVAQAQADAALLMGPSVIAQAVRYPAGAIADSTGLQVGQGWQPRVAASIGLLDLYKGVGALDVGRADCHRELAFEELRDLLDQKEDIGRAPALEREVEVLHRRRPEVEALVAKAEERLAAHLSTVLEVSEIRRKALDLNRKTAQAEGDLAMLSHRHERAPSRPILELLEAYDTKALAYDASVSHVRNLDPWRFNVQGGAVTTPTVDYFAVVELAYNFGGIARSAAESRSLEARAREIKNARYELHAQVVLLLDELRSSVAQMRSEIKALDDHATRTQTTLASLSDADAPNAPQVVAQLRIESIELEADRTYLAALVEQRTALEGSHESH